MKSQVTKSRSKYLYFVRLSSLFLALCLALVLFMPISASASTTKQKLDAAKKHLSELEAEYKSTQAQLSELRSEEARLSDELTWLETRSAEQNQVYQDALQQKETAYEIMLLDEEAYQGSLQRLADKQEQYGERLS